MARKPRDYKAEYARRKARLNADPVKKRAYYQRQYEKDVQRAIRRGYGSTRQMKAAARERERRDPVFAEQYRQSVRWSQYRAQSEKAVFDPGRAKDLGVTEEAYTKAYWEAWVMTYEADRYAGSEQLRYWLLDLNHFPDYNLTKYREHYPGA